MPDDRREGLDRRDNETAITLGEVFRICQRIDAQLSEMKEGTDKDVHSLRSQCQTHAISLALLKDKVDALESKGRDWRGWIASGLVGGILALMPFAFQWFAKHS